MDISPFRKFFEYAFTRHPSNPLLFDTSVEGLLSYSEGKVILDKISRRIGLSGFVKGDIIITYTPLNINSVFLFWGCILNGLVFVPVDHNWPPAMLSNIIEETEPKMILTDEERLSSIAALVPNENILLVEKSNQQSQNQCIREWLETEEVSMIIQNTVVEADDLAVILYTSGSTGRPKGVMLSHKALLHSSRTIVELFSWTSDDIFMNLGNLHTMSGLRNTCLAPLHVGASFIVASQEERNSILHVFNLVNKYHITYLGIAPIVIREMNILFSNTRNKLLTSLKALLCTGAAVSRDQMHKYYDLYKKPVLNYYGLTETAGICSGHNLQTFSPEDTSIGRPVNAEFIVVPDENGKTQQDIGELIVKSDGLMLGYFKNIEETRVVLHEGRFATGDIVKKRSDGCFELLGRKRNIVKSSRAELIYLEEIDKALEFHPFIREACACRYSRYEEDEKIVAFIVLDSSIKESRTIIRSLEQDLGEMLGIHRTPWRYFIEDKLPRNSMGKIQREELGKKVHEYIQSGHQRHF